MATIFLLCFYPVYDFVISRYRLMSFDMHVVIAEFRKRVPCEVIAVNSLQSWLVVLFSLPLACLRRVGMTVRDLFSFLLATGNVMCLTTRLESVLVVFKWFFLHPCRLPWLRFRVNLACL